MFLNSFDIQNMYCENELTILSACETGTGEYVSGEGVSSIARSFKYAGSKNIITVSYTHLTLPTKA